MSLIKQAVSIAAIALLAVTTSIYAQGAEPGRSQTRAPEKQLVPLKVLVIISRYEGDKKVSNLPFILWVNANDEKQTELNVGSQVAVPSSDKSVSYRAVGTSMTCGGSQLEDGRFRLQLSISDSSVAPSRDSSGYPSFQSFTTQSYLLLRDGQTAQFVAATDKVTGEITKVDVSIGVLK